LEAREPVRRLHWGARFGRREHDFFERTRCAPQDAREVDSFEQSAQREDAAARLDSRKKVRGGVR
jgi:hypothetical protein